MSGEGLRDRVWRSVEGAIDPFQDTDREVLPEDAWRFILYFANQAKGAFVAAAGRRRAGRRRRCGDVLVGRLAGRPARPLEPATLFADHWPALLGLLLLHSGGAHGGDGRVRRWSSSS